MRAEIRTGSDLGREFNRFVREGKLVPDKLVLELVRARLMKEDAKSGAIFDGYPRTTVQAVALEELLQGVGRRIDLVIALDVPLEAILDRMTDRRIDPSTGQVYHLRYNPPPVGVSVEQRRDDEPEIVKGRYEDYQQKTLPVLIHYGQRGVVEMIDGSGKLDEVTKAIEYAINKRQHSLESLIGQSIGRGTT